MITPTYDNILSNPKATDPRVFTRNYPEFAKWLVQQYPDSPTLSEKLYRYFHHLDQRPVCEVCGKPVAYKNIRKGYSRTCSKTCTFQSSHRKEVRAATCLERYGVENPAQSKEVMDRARATMMERYGVEHALQKKEFLDKSKATCREHYGVDYPGQSEELKKRAAETNMRLYGTHNVFASDVIKERIVQTNRERYGVDWAINNPEIKKKAQVSCVEHYGVDNPFKSSEIQKKIYQKTIQRSKLSRRGMIDMYNDSDCEGIQIYKCNGPKRGCPKDCPGIFEIPCSLYYQRSIHNMEICTILNPIGNNNTNTSLESFIRNILEQYNIPYITNTRKIIPPYELDIYLPEHKIAIECNGIYWHSQKDDNYHYNKWLTCKETGVLLLTIWEDWIINKPNIVKSIILSKLDIYDQTISAKQCKVFEIGQEELSNFLNINHIYGATKSSIRLGLKYKGELVAVTTFVKRSKNKHEIWELTRVCSKINTNIIGAHEKLIEYFIHTYQPADIISYISNDTGDILSGFTKTNEYKIGSWRIHQRTLKRYSHSYRFKNNDIKKANYLCIHDSGMTKYILKLS